MLPGWLNVVVSWPCRGGRATLAQINNPSDPNAKSDERRGCFMEFVLPVELCQEWISTRSSKSAQHTPFRCPESVTQKQRRIRHLGVQVGDGEPVNLQDQWKASLIQINY